MRFGAAFIPGMSTSDVVRTARMIEELGYDDLWVPDQSFHWDPFVLPALCARATSKVRLGVAVTNPYTRHPVQIARAAAALHDVSGGRFVLGLGAGNRTRVLPALGLPTDRTAPRLEETIDVCRRLLRGERVTVDSPTLTLHRVKLETTRASDVPIYVGSRAPGLLRLAGARANGVFMEAMCTPEGLDYAIGQVERGARATGRRLEDIDVVAWQAIRVDTANPSPDTGEVRNWAGMIIRGTHDRILETIGIPPPVREGVRSDFDRFGEEGVGRRVPDDVVARLLLVGEPEALVSRIREVAERGVDGVSIITFGKPDVMHAAIRTFALEVLPRFAS